MAKTIQFKTSDLETLYAIQAALAVPQAQIQALQQELAGQKQYNSIQDQAIAAGKTADAAINKRISDLADYDQKEELIVLFDINSAAVSSVVDALGATPEVLMLRDFIAALPHGDEIDRLTAPSPATHVHRPVTGGIG